MVTCKSYCVLVGLMTVGCCGVVSVAVDTMMLLVTPGLSTRFMICGAVLLNNLFWSRSDIILALPIPELPIVVFPIVTSPTVELPES